MSRITFKIEWLGQRWAPDHKGVDELRLWGWGSVKGRAYTFWRNNGRMVFKPSETYARSVFGRRETDIASLILEKQQKGYERVKADKVIAKEIRENFILSQIAGDLHLGKRRAA